MSNLLSKAVKNSTWTAIGSLGTAILAFFFAGLTIRWLGEAEAGFALAIAAIIGINNTFSGFGLGTAATRLISQAYEKNNTQEIRKIAGVCFSTTLGFGLFGFSLFTFGSPWIVQWSKYQGDSGTGSKYCILLGAVFLLQQITGYFNIFLNALQRYDWQTKLNTTFMLANGLLGITLLKAFPNILTLALIQLTLSFLNCLSTGIIVKKIIGFITFPSWNQAMFIQLWSFGKWVYLTQIKGLLIDGMDKIFLTSVFGSASLPFYVFAQRIYLTVHGMLVGQSSYLFPMLSAQGDKLEAVAEQIEDRLRWFIGLIAASIYSGLIIVGPALLTVVVSAEFSSKASYQLFIFSLVGYINANAIVPFYFGLSMGDAKGNWIYHMIIGLSYFPLFVIFALLFGVQYAVTGHLMTLCGAIYLSRRLKPNMKWTNFSIWLIRPLYSSLLLMFIACCLHVTLNLLNANNGIQITTMIVFCLIAVLAIPRLEIAYFGGITRLETLGKAIALVGGKLGISDRLIFRLLGIKQSN